MGLPPPGFATAVSEVESTGCGESGIGLGLSTVWWGNGSGCVRVRAGLGRVAIWLW